MLIPQIARLFRDEPLGRWRASDAIDSRPVRIGHWGSECVSRRPNGTLVDVHPAFTDQGLMPPSLDQVHAATIGAFGQAAPSAKIYDRAYQSYYPEHPSQNAIQNYDTHINDFWEGQRNADQAGNQGRVRAGAPSSELVFSRTRGKKPVTSPSGSASPPRPGSTRQNPASNATSGPPRRGGAS
jgi:hypothetical protein